MHEPEGARPLVATAAEIITLCIGQTLQMMLDPLPARTWPDVAQICVLGGICAQLLSGPELLSFHYL